MQSALSIQGKRKKNMKASWNYSSVFFLFCFFFPLSQAEKQLQSYQRETAEIRCWCVLEELDFLVLSDNSIIKHDRSFRMKVQHGAISSKIHFFVTLNSVSLNEFITPWQDTAAYMRAALTARFIRDVALSFFLPLSGQGIVINRDCAL